MNQVLLKFLIIYILIGFSANAIAQHQKFGVGAASFFIWRINQYSDFRSKNKKYVVSSDESGAIKLFRYPVLQKGAEYVLVAFGHTTMCTKARFNSNDTYLITIGGKDRSILQWQVVQNENAQN